MDCKIINIVWPDRGILLSIIVYIIKFYDNLLEKIIIIDNKRYRKFLRKLFTEFKFSKFVQHDEKNFYFNIRTIIKKQDVIIDYLANYETYINASTLSFVPWYDMNDPLIIYKYNQDKKLLASVYKKFIKKFSLCRRGNYNGYPWDAVLETYILNMYKKYMKKQNINHLLHLLNKTLESEYTNTVNYKNILYPYIIKEKQEITKNSTQQNNDNIDELIKLISEKINSINNLII